MDKTYLQYYVAKEAGVFSSSLRALAKANKLQFGDKRITAKALKNMSYGDKRQLMQAFRQQAGGGDVRSALKSNNMTAMSDYAHNLDAYQQQASTKAYQSAVQNAYLNKSNKWGRQQRALNYLNREPMQTAQSWMGNSYQLQPYSLTANRATIPSAFGPRLSYDKHLAHTMTPARSRRAGIGMFPLFALSNVASGAGSYAAGYLQSKSDQHKQRGAKGITVKHPLRANNKLYKE